MTHGRTLAFACATLLLTSLSAVAVLAALDIYARHRASDFGLNAWGYRGPAVARKQPGELRIVALGGSTVFGYGLPWAEAWPHYLEKQLALARRDRVTTVVNLGLPRDSAGTFATTLDDYDYLRPDAVILYEGYNDLDAAPDQTSHRDATNYLSLRHQSPIFRWTGYLPILPLILNDKATALMHGGRLDSGDSSREIVFRPGLATRATAGALKATAEIEVSLEERFGRLSRNGLAAPNQYDVTCGPWSRYCGAVQDAVRKARQRGERVFVVGQPYLSDLHLGEQRALESSLRREFGGNPFVRYVNLGPLIDLHDQSLAYDGLHLTALGNQRVAAALVTAVLGEAR